MLAQEEELLREVKSWRAKLPAPEIDILIVDEIGKNISGAGMDTKVINRGINGDYNPFPDTPIVHRVYARALNELSYHSGIGIGLADMIHDRLLNDIDWKPTYINSLTASTPAGVRTPIHYGSDLEALTNLAPTVGKIDLSDVTYCRIRNTLELTHAAVSENLIPRLYPNAEVVSVPFAAPLSSSHDLGDFEAAAESVSAYSEALRH